MGTIIMNIEALNTNHTDDQLQDDSIISKKNILYKIDQRKSKILSSFGDRDNFSQDNIVNDVSDYFESKLGIKKMNIENEILSAKIYKIKGNDVIVDMGLKNYGKIDKDELRIGMHALNVFVGDTIGVVAQSIDAKHGAYIKASWEKAKRVELWDKFLECMNNKTIVQGAIINETRGGYIINIHGVKCFLPGSHVAYKPPEKSEINELKLNEQSFMVLSMERDEKKDNIVVSRREVLNLDKMKIKDIAIERIKVGDVVIGIVKSITPYGAFVNIQIPATKENQEEICVDGLLHINDMSWSKITHPSEMFSLGDEVKVMITALVPAERKISLSVKALQDSPWKGLSQTLAIGTCVTGVITNTMDYGYFVKIADCVEGLVHVSEVSWSKKNANLTVGQEVKVMVLEIDEEKARISLSIKRCFDNPWKKFAEKNKIGDIIEVAIKKVVDFGVFVDLDSDIEGLIHVSDVSWNGNEVTNCMNSYRVSSKISVKILSIDTEKGRVALGVKQLQNDHLEEFLKTVNIGDIINNCVVVGALNDKVEVEITQAQTNFTITSENLPCNFSEIRQTKFCKHTRIDCKVIDLDAANRKISLQVALSE